MYLAPTERIYTDWTAMTHSTLVGALGLALHRLKSPSLRYAGAAALYDMSANFGGDLQRCLLAQKQWYARPVDFQATMELVSAIRGAQGAHWAGFQAILEVSNGNGRS